MTLPARAVAQPGKRHGAGAWVSRHDDRDVGLLVGAGEAVHEGCCLLGESQCRWALVEHGDAATDRLPAFVGKQEAA